MADTKISALPASTTPLAGTELVPIVQGGITKKVAVSDLTAGRTVAGSNFLAASDSGNGFFVVGNSTTAPGFQIYGKSSGTAPGWVIYKSGTADFVGVHAWYKSDFAGTDTYLGGWYSNGDYKLNSGNVVIGTAGKGITNSGGTVALAFNSGGTALTGSQSTLTGSFNNVGTAQTITVTDTNGGFVAITAVQGGIGSSTWTIPFAKRGGAIGIGTASKAFVTADPISAVGTSGGNITVTPVAGNTYFTYAIYYTPLGT
jgi:hypothetical protein